MATILIIDDEHLTVEMLATFLKLLGHESVPALSGKQAREKLAAGLPDAVLLDIMLPDTSGLDFCRELRSNPATASLPVIITSAYSPPRTQQAAEAGASGYLAKPITLKTLREMLNTVGIADARAR